MKISRINNPVLVTGIERSGSSMIARILAMSGAWTGRRTAMMENRQIKQALDRFYSEIQADPAGQFPLPNVEDLRENGKWSETIKTILQREGYPEEKIWMYKSHRICQTWPIWAHAFPDAKFVIVRRRSGDVINSCTKTAFMNAYSDKEVQDLIQAPNEEEGWKWWIHQHEDRFVEMIKAGLNCRVVWPDRMLEGDYSQIAETLDWLRLRWSGKIIPMVEQMLHKEKNYNENNSSRS